MRAVLVLVSQKLRTTTLRAGGTNTPIVSNVTCEPLGRTMDSPTATALPKHSLSISITVT